MIKITDEIKHALATNKAVVALESTVISHGLPFPANLVIAQELEKTVRDEGAIPAIIALINGEIRIGLHKHELELLADPKTTVRKVSRRDIAYTLAIKSYGATTVSATMFLAHQARLRIFATGGIGGVHRGAEYSMDISADLYELGTTPIGVVCAGAKSILDLPKTLEVLESLGVGVWGFKTEYFPEFFCRTNRYKLDMNFNDANNIAQALALHWELGLKNGVVIAQPVPIKDALDAELIERSIKEALILAEKNHIHGKALTPFLLQHIAKITKGQSLASNKALLIENARLAAHIAIAINRQKIPTTHVQL